MPGESVCADRRLRHGQFPVAFVELMYQVFYGKSSRFAARARDFTDQIAAGQAGRLVIQERDEILVSGLAAKSKINLVQ